LKFNKSQEKNIERDVKTSYAKLMEEMANSALNIKKFRDLLMQFVAVEYNFEMPKFNLAFYSDSLEKIDNVKGLQLYINQIHVSGKVIKLVINHLF
jgi:hypothetical protein